MIKPNKFTILERSTLYAAALIIQYMRKANNKCSYDNLYDELRNELHDDTFYLIMPALDFLFLMGKIEYNSLDDNLEMTI